MVKTKNLLNLGFVLLLALNSNSNATEKQNNKMQDKAVTHADDYSCCDTHKPKTYFNKDLSESLYLLIENGDLEVIKKYINQENVDYYLEIDNCQQNLISTAIMHDKLSIVLYLLEQGAAVNGTQCSGYISCETPLELAIFSGSLPIIKSLVEHGADTCMKINKEGATILFCAYANHQLAELMVILETNESFFDEISIINLVDNMKEIIKYIMRYGVDINAIEEFGEADWPHNGVKRTMLDLMELCLHEKINHVNTNTEDKRTLKNVLIREYKKIIDYLVQIGAKRASEL